VPLEVLHCPFVLFGRCAGLKSSEIAPAACFGVLLARVQAVLAGFELSDHRDESLCSFLLLVAFTRLRCPVFASGAGLVAAALFLVHGGLTDLFGALFGHTLLLISFGDVFSLALLAFRMFVLVSSRHALIPHL
jgi:hypothetical protein